SLTGSLSGTVTITTRGASADDMLAAARGTGRVTIADGVIPGLEMVRTVVLAFGKPSGAAPGGSGSAFKQITAVFSLANRTLHSDNLSFNSRDFDMAGASTIRLPEGGIEMRTSVRLSPELTAQAGTDLRRFTQEEGRIVVPAVISGTIAAPSVMVDVKAVATRAVQNEVKRQVRGLFDRFIKK
ncbi:MAG: AsmA-like C-terminal region-containing protein, partial [Vicinamibacterales bacterium]